MKRIVIDARESGTSTGRYIDKLVEYLHRLQPAEEIIVLAKPQQLDFFKQIAPNFRAVACPIKEFTFAEQFRLLHQIRRLKADLVFFPQAQQPVLYFGRTITTMQDLTTARFRNLSKNWLVFTFKQQVYKFVNVWVAHKSRALITPSKFVKQDVAHYCHVKPAKITVTYESADKITTSAEPIGQLNKQPFIMYVGRPMSHKNLPRLVDAFAILRQTRPELKLVLVGKTDANFKQLKAYADHQTEGVVFTDFVSEGQLRWLYENAQAYVFPSLSEGFGLPGLEAMQYGLPVVSSNATCLPEIYQDAALYFDPLNTQDMADKIGQVLNDPKLATELAAKGTKLVNTYSWQRMAEQTLKVFRQQLNN